MTLSYNHRKGTEFKELPAIYAIELTAACDLKCPMCLRTTDMESKKPSLFDLKLLKKMVYRGDFDGTTYTELQMAGEPTIHPHLEEVITLLQSVGVKVGLSTHGHNMNRAGLIEKLLLLNALTISVDSTDPEVYARMRVPKQLSDLIPMIERFYMAWDRRRRASKPVPFVELQLVRTPREPKSGDLEALKALMADHAWEGFHARVTDDCFTEMQGLVNIGEYVERGQAPCLNPFMSVNISQDGDVVSCCYIFDQNKNAINYYGSLKEQTLREIWEGERAQAMRQSQTSGALKDQCRACYYKSPILIHHGITARLQRHERTFNA